MRKPITPYGHGIIDYATAATVAAAPRLLGLSERAANTCYLLAGSYAALSMLTDYPLAVKRVIPFKAHGFTEGAIGAALPMVPWMLGLAGERRARNLFFGLAALTGVVAALTDWDDTSEQPARRRRRRLAHA